MTCALDRPFHSFPKPASFSLFLSVCLSFWAQVSLLLFTSHPRSNSLAWQRRRSSFIHLLSTRTLPKDLHHSGRAVYLPLILDYRDIFAPLSIYSRLHLHRCVKGGLHTRLPQWHPLEILPSQNHSYGNQVGMAQMTPQSQYVQKHHHH